MESLIHFWGTINQSSVQTLRNISLEAINRGTTKLNINFSSIGGDVNSGFITYNFLRSLPIPVRMYNCSSVDSIGVIIYLSADERITTYNSKFMIHKIGINIDKENLSIKRLEELMSLLLVDTNRYIDTFETRTRASISPSDIRNCLLGERHISAVDALAAAICTSIADTDAFITRTTDGSIIAPSDTYWANF